MAVLECAKNPNTIFSEVWFFFLEEALYYYNYYYFRQKSIFKIAREIDCFPLEMLSN